VRLFLKIWRDVSVGDKMSEKNQPRAQHRESHGLDAVRRLTRVLTWMAVADGSGGSRTTRALQGDEAENGGSYERGAPSRELTDQGSKRKAGHGRGRNACRDEGRSTGDSAWRDQSNAETGPIAQKRRRRCPAGFALTP